MSINIKSEGQLLHHASAHMHHDYRKPHRTESRPRCDKQRPRKASERPHTAPQTSQTTPRPSTNSSNTPPPPPLHRQQSMDTPTKTRYHHQSDSPKPSGTVRRNLSLMRTKFKRIFSGPHNKAPQEDLNSAAAAKEAALRQQQRRASLAPTIETYETSTSTHYSYSPSPLNAHLRPATPAGYTTSQLSVLINRWLTTQPGLSSHPQNVEIAALVQGFRQSAGSASTNNLLFVLLSHRKNMDLLIERLARDVGLTWEVGIERFVPPPNRRLSVGAREMLRGCRDKEWVGWLMPDVAVAEADEGNTEGEGAIGHEKRNGRRYRKVKYWLFEVAAGNGWDLPKLERRVVRWFERSG